MAQVRCEMCGATIEEQRAVKVGNQTLCPSCAQKVRAQAGKPTKK